MGWTKLEKNEIILNLNKSELCTLLLASIGITVAVLAWLCEIAKFKRVRRST